MESKEKGLKQFFGSRLGRIQLFYILLFSSLVTLVGTSIQLLIEYRTDIDIIEQKVDEIQQSHLSSLTNSLWILDDAQLQIQLNDLVKLGDIVFIEILEGEETIYSAGIRPNSDFIVRHYDMNYESKATSEIIGVFMVYGSLDGVYTRLYQRITVILATQAIKTFLVSFFVLFIVYRLVIRHLLKLARHAQKLELETSDVKLELNRKGFSSNRPDELDLLVDSFNEMYRRLSDDVLEKEKAERDLKSSLKEKETLLQEVHHRVKNNMQVIASLLSLQSIKSRHKETKFALEDSRDRVYAMASVHQTLYQSGQLDAININYYLKNLVESLYQSSKDLVGKISLLIEIGDIQVGIDQASPLGLVVNELISNSFKHGFKDRDKGEIKIVAQVKENNKLELLIQDDGAGMPPDQDWRKLDSLGLHLVKTLVENQLEGELTMQSNMGTAFTITFPLKKQVG